MRKSFFTVNIRSMSTNQHISNDTIVALATPYGIGAIAVIRLSGPQTFSICESVFVTSLNLWTASYPTLCGVSHGP